LMAEKSAELMAAWRAVDSVATLGLLKDGMMDAK
jgi:hypothetical protein